MRRVVWSEDALDGFDAIVAYIARDNPGAVAGGVTVTVRAIPILEEVP